MKQKIFDSSIYILFLGSFLFLSGCGLFNTAFSILIKQNTQSLFILGLASSLYFFGILLGALRISILIRIIGILGSFSILVSILTISTLLPMIYGGIILLILCRVIQGICIAGVFMIIEGWILSSSPEKYRGKALSYYMALLYSSFAIGQLFLIGEYINLSMRILIMSAILSMSSIIPLSIIKSAPPLGRQMTSDIFVLVKKSVLGTVCCVISGIILSSLITIYPLYALEMSGKPREVAIAMLIVFSCGTIIQYPIGYLTDKFDKHKVVFIICCIFSFASIVLSIGHITLLINQYHLRLVSVFLGILSFSLYPVGTNIICENLKNLEVIRGLELVLISYGIGCIIGPIYVAILMKNLGLSGYFIALSLLMICMVLFISFFYKLFNKNSF